MPGDMVLVSSENFEITYEHVVYIKHGSGSAMFSHFTLENSMEVEASSNHIMCIYDQKVNKLETKRADEVTVGEYFMTMDNNALKKSKVVSRNDAEKNATYTYFQICGFPVVNGIIASPRTAGDVPEKFNNSTLDMYHQYGWEHTSKFLYRIMPQLLKIRENAKVKGENELLKINDLIAE